MFILGTKNMKRLRMTEEMVEQVIEKRMDRLDARFLKGEVTQAEYDAAVRQLDALARVKI